MSRLFHASLAILAAVGAAVAASAAAAPGAMMTPEQVIAARQAGYDMSVMTMTEMKLAAANGSDIKKQFYPARVLGKWARVLPTMFPEGTGQGATAVETHALPAVWTDRATFEKDAAAYAAAADKLSELAQAGDAAGFTAQLGVVGKTCDTCHETFKAK